MKVSEFKAKITSIVAVGDIYPNPGGGTTEIISVTDDGIRYKRGNSTISVKWLALDEAYQHFRGGVTSASDLKAKMPYIFDPKARPAGHSCNCTFLFAILEKAGLAGPILGKGVRGDPFAAELY